MHTPRFERTLRAAAATVAALLAGTAQAALQDRDLDGNGATDAFYDTDLNITWLRDADMNGAMPWHAAVSWADGLSFAGHADWRLPLSDFVCHPVFGCTGEMGHLWSFELGNPPGGPMTNRGDFLNLQSSFYWTATVYPSLSPLGWAFGTVDGLQRAFAIDASLHAMAVRDGDVPAIPEPGTCALLLAGLAGLALRRRAAVRG